MVIRTFFDTQRQSSLLARRDKTWSSAPFLISRDNQVRWHAETKHGHAPFCNLETIKSDGTRRLIMVMHTLFAIQRQSSPMACRDKTWSSEPFLLSRDNKLWWHTETNHCQPHPFSYPETIKSVGTLRQNMVIQTLFSIQRQSSLMARRDKSWSSAPFFYPETIKSDGMRRQNKVIRTLYAI